MKLTTRLPRIVAGISVDTANLYPAILTDVDLEDVICDSQLLRADKLLSIAAAKSTPPIGVIQWRSDLYLWDGRHRAWVAWIRGIKIVSAFVQFLPDGGSATGEVKK